MEAGQEPIPSSQAASCMKAAAWPASNITWNFTEGSGVRMATARAAPAIWPAHSPHSDRDLRIAGSWIAMNCQAWLFLEDCERLPAFNIARIASSGRGSLENFLTARLVLI